MSSFSRVKLSKMARYLAHYITAWMCAICHKSHVGNREHHSVSTCIKSSRFLLHGRGTQYIHLRGSQEIDRAARNMCGVSSCNNDWRVLQNINWIRWIVCIWWTVTCRQTSYHFRVLDKCLTILPCWFILAVAEKTGIYIVIKCMKLHAWFRVMFSAITYVTQAVCFRRCVSGLNWINL